jgi:PhzF family phenazine biosynthesis protein
MKNRAFQQVDVFASQPYTGNALAVVLDGADLSDAAMQSFARWTQLPETTFLLPPSPQAAAAGADYQVRIFTPSYEMPFAGHPTLGSCYAWLQAGGRPRAPVQANGDMVVVQQCQQGLVVIRSNAIQTAPNRQRLAFAAPPLQHSALSKTAHTALAHALGLQAAQIQGAQHLNNGPQQVGFWLDNADSVASLAPDHAALMSVMQRLEVSGVGVASLVQQPGASGLIARSNREARAFSASGALGAPAPVDAPAQPATQTAMPTDLPTDAQVLLRFFSHNGIAIVEDPVTGSFNASMAQWLRGLDCVPQSYTVAQGAHVGADGRVYIAQDASGQVWVGGDVVSCVQGRVCL